MTFTLVLLLIGALLLLVIGINVIQQQKERAEAEKRIEIARQRAIIDETEEVLSNTGMFPCTQNLSLVLYQRVYEALQSASSLSGKQQADYRRRMTDIQGQIQKINSTPATPPSIESFRLPDDERKVLVIVQTLKKLKAILRAEHNKGKVEPSIFATEEGRIDSLQLRINVEAMISRGRAACYLKQYGSAKQMVTKALGTLQAIKAQSPNDPFIGQKVDEAKQMLAEIMGAQEESATLTPKPKKKEEDDIDMLFQPKKKW